MCDLPVIRRTVFFTGVCLGALSAQTGMTAPASMDPAEEVVATSPLRPPTLPKGTLLQVALDGEVRVRKVGQPVHGRLVQPVYMADRKVLPAGAPVTGQIKEIAPIPKKVRTLAILNGHFTPPR